MSSTVSQDIPRLYQYIFLRDPAEAEVAYWEAELERDNSRDLVWEFIESEEAQDAGYGIVASYQIAFGRVPDRDGFFYWQERVDERDDVDFMIREFVGSDEFQTRFDVEDRAEVVSALYANAFGREPEPAGLLYWVNSEYTYPQMVRAFMSSMEWLERAHTKIAEFYDDIANGGDDGDGDQDDPGSLFEVEAPIVLKIGDSSPGEGDVQDLTPEIVGTARPGYTIILLVDGVEAGRTTTDAEGNWTLTPAEALEPGTRSLTIVAEDQAGGRSDATQSIEVEIVEGGADPDPEPNPNPDPDADVDAVDDTAAAQIVLTPRVTETEGPAGSESILVAIGWQESFDFQVPAGVTRDALVSVSSSSLLAVLDGISATLLKQDGQGNWEEIGNTSEPGLLDLLGLTGQDAQIQASDLTEGNYRVEINAPVVAVGTTISFDTTFTDTSLTEFDAQGVAVTGNILAGDDLGPEGTVSLSIETDDGFVPAGGGSIDGQYGTLTIAANGEYTYTPFDDAASVGNEEVFTYRIEHENGSTDTATLTIELQGSASEGGDVAGLSALALPFGDPAGDLVLDELVLPPGADDSVGLAQEGETATVEEASQEMVQLVGVADTPEMMVVA